MLYYKSGFINNTYILDYILFVLSKSFNEEFINEDSIDNAEFLIEDINVYKSEINNPIIQNKDWKFALLWNNSEDISHYEKYNLVLGNRLSILNFISVPDIIPYIWHKKIMNNNDKYIDLDRSKEIVICAYDNRIFSTSFQRILNLFYKTNIRIVNINDENIMNNPNINKFVLIDEYNKIETNITIKIIDAFEKGLIPIYNGSHYITDYIDNKYFININESNFNIINNDNDNDLLNYLENNFYKVKIPYNSVLCNNITYYNDIIIKDIYNALCNNLIGYCKYNKIPSINKNITHKFNNQLMYDSNVLDFSNMRSGIYRLNNDLLNKYNLIRHDLSKLKDIFEYITNRDYTPFIKLYVEGNENNVISQDTFININSEYDKINGIDHIILLYPKKLETIDKYYEISKVLSNISTNVTKITKITHYKEEMKGEEMKGEEMKGVESKVEEEINNVLSHIKALNFCKKIDNKNNKNNKDKSKESYYLIIDETINITDMYLSNFQFTISDIINSSPKDWDILLLNRNNKVMYNSLWTEYNKVLAKSSAYIIRSSALDKLRNDETTNINDTNAIITYNEQFSKIYYEKFVNSLLDYIDDDEKDILLDNKHYYMNYIFCNLNTYLFKYNYFEMSNEISDNNYIKKNKIINNITLAKYKVLNSNTKYYINKQYVIFKDDICNRIIQFTYDLIKPYVNDEINNKEIILYDKYSNKVCENGDYIFIVSNLIL